MRILILFLLLFLLSCTQKEAIKQEEGKKWKSDVSSDVETEIDIDSIYFNSRDTNCKFPFGAVPQGETIKIRIFTRKDDVSNIILKLVERRIFGNMDSEKFVAFTNTTMTKSNFNENLDVWESKFRIFEIGCYGYYFEIYKNSNDFIILANNQNKVDVPYVKVMGTGGVGKFTPPNKYKLPFYLNIYTNKLILPDWTSNLVIYYIFPERFKNGNKNNDPKVGIDKFYGNKDIEYHSNWCDIKPYVPGNSDGNTNDDNEYCNDFYGGDLDGIIQKLDYIKSLGINVIYINPIFKAPSNHKYDTANYLEIDEHFGDLETFKKLIIEAKKRNIRIILDTSLNHCGSDSIYMDRYSKYETYGAFEGEIIRPDSPYFNWFEFNPKAKNPDQKYNQWANPTLANLKESESFKNFAYRSSNSVMKYWLSMGIGGWRMDVTPWVSDDFWKEWRYEIKKDYPDAFTIAEVWFDASKYLLGNMFDSTMNYIFRTAVINFAKGLNAKKSMETLEMIRENYPEPIFYRLMNLISSHDVPRCLYELGYRNYGDKNYELFKKRLFLAFAIQFTYPGAPTIYYGDEVGMTGGHDPFNRGPFPWKEDGCNYFDESVLSEVIKLSSIRQNNPALIYGKITPIYSDNNIIAYERTLNDLTYLIILNNSTNDKIIESNILKDFKYIDIINNIEYNTKNINKLIIKGLSYYILKKISE